VAGAPPTVAVPWGAGAPGAKGVAPGVLPLPKMAEARRAMAYDRIHICNAERCFLDRHL
jgi:hypothetical protein